MELVFATNNRHKIEEVNKILSQYDINIISLADIGCHDDIPETSATLEGNASQKAHFIYDKFGKDCFADDTGLEVKALGNAPGVFSARYAGAGHDSEANMNKLLSEMKGYDNRKARFRTVIALIIGGNEYRFEGKINGAIASGKSGDTGFGYDPIFIPEGYNETFATLGEEIKNRISHRAKAVEQLEIFLASLNK